MKNSWICLLFVILFVSCEKEIVNTAGPVITPPKLSTISQGDADLNRFFYEDDLLVLMEQDFYNYDPDTDSSWYSVNSTFFDYENGKLSKVTRGSKEILISYAGDDMFINDFHHANAFDNHTLIFKNYKSKEDFQIWMQDAFGLIYVMVKANFDDAGNFTYATDLDGVDIEESYPGVYYLSQYYGTHSYIDQLHFAKAFPLEVQLFLYQKPFNYSIDEVDWSYKTTSYSYEFNDEGLLKKSQAMTKWDAGSEHIFPEKVYFYE
jgi:hypothetical protein